jgi:hypothetical protein
MAAPSVFSTAGHRSVIVGPENGWVGVIKSNKNNMLEYIFSVGPIWQFRVAALFGGCRVGQRIAPCASLSRDGNSREGRGNTSSNESFEFAATDQFTPQDRALTLPAIELPTAGLPILPGGVCTRVIVCTMCAPSAHSDDFRFPTWSIALPLGLMHRSSWAALYPTEIRATGVGWSRHRLWLFEPPASRGRRSCRQVLALHERHCRGALSRGGSKALS